MECEFSWCVPPCVAKACADRPLGELQAADPTKCPRGYAANAILRGHNLRLLDEAGSRAPAARRTRKPGQSAQVASTQELQNLLPLTAFKNAPNPKFVQNLSQRLFLGVPVRGSNICKKWSKFENRNFQTSLDNFSQMFDPLTGTPKNNRWDKFWTNLTTGDVGDYDDRSHYCKGLSLCVRDYHHYSSKEEERLTMVTTIGVSALGEGCHYDTSQNLLPHQIKKQFVKNCQNLSENYGFSNFDHFLQMFDPLTGTPKKQSLGQILDKFGVRGVFECCKGKKVPQGKSLDGPIRANRFADSHEHHPIRQEKGT